MAQPFAVRSTPDPPSGDIDRWVVLTGVTWPQYEALLDLFGDDHSGVRVAYFKGLTDGGYERRDTSLFLLGLDFDRLASFVEMRSQTKAVRAFLDDLRRR
jgi:hypothetical protein